MSKSFFSFSPKSFLQHKITILEHVFHEGNLFISFTASERKQRLRIEPGIYSLTY